MPEKADAISWEHFVINNTEHYLVEAAGTSSTLLCNMFKWNGSLEN